MKNTIIILAVILLGSLCSIAESLKDIIASIPHSMAATGAIGVAVTNESGYALWVGTVHSTVGDLELKKHLLSYLGGEWTEFKYDYKEVVGKAVKSLEEEGRQVHPDASSMRQFILMNKTDTNSMLIVTYNPLKKEDGSQEIAFGFTTKNESSKQMQATGDTLRVSPTPD